MKSYFPLFLIAVFTGTTAGATEISQFVDSVRAASEYCSPLWSTRQVMGSEWLDAELEKLPAVDHERTKTDPVYATELFSKIVLANRLSGAGSRLKSEAIFEKSKECLFEIASKAAALDTFVPRLKAHGLLKAEILYSLRDAIAAVNGLGGAKRNREMLDEMGKVGEMTVDFSLIRSLSWQLKKVIDPYLGAFSGMTVRSRADQLLRNDPDFLPGMKKDRELADLLDQYFSKAHYDHPGYNYLKDVSSPIPEVLVVWEGWIMNYPEPRAPRESDFVPSLDETGKVLKKAEALLTATRNSLLGLAASPDAPDPLMAISNRRGDLHRMITVLNAYDKIPESRALRLGRVKRLFEYSVELAKRARKSPGGYGFYDIDQRIKSADENFVPVAQMLSELDSAGAVSRISSKSRRFFDFVQRAISISSHHICAEFADDAAARSDAQEKYLDFLDKADAIALRKLEQEPWWSQFRILIHGR